MIPQISASQLAKITGVSHGCPEEIMTFNNIKLSKVAERFSKNIYINSK
jgi:hypothetical protein